VDVLAHRGLPGPGRPENTVRAIIAAVDAGLDGIETDLRVTADGVVVLNHDADLLRAAADPVHVEGTAWPELRDAGAAAGLSLARLTDALPALSACRRVVLEVKTPDTDGLSRPEAAVGRVARVVAGELSVLLPSLAASRVTVSSFDEALLGQIRREFPGTPPMLFGLLTAGVAPAEVLHRAVAAGWDEVHVRLADLRTQPPTRKEPLTRKEPTRKEPPRHPPTPPGRRRPDVVAWTATTAADLQWCAGQDVSAVIADPAAVLRRVPVDARNDAARTPAYGEAPVGRR